MPNPKLYLEDPDFAKYEAMLELGDKLDEVNDNILGMDKSHAKMMKMETEIKSAVEKQLGEMKKEINDFKSEVPNLAKIVSMVKVDKGETGEEGYTPQAGIDFYTAEEKEYFKEKCTPVKGEDYFTDKDIKEIAKLATPVKGEDYFTKNEIKDFKKEITPVKGEDYFDGKDGEKGGQGYRGEKGERGDKGDVGDVPKHEWQGTNLRFELPKNKWGQWVDLGARYGGISRGGSNSFLELNDTPNSYAGQTGKVPVVNAGETGLEFSTVSATPGGAATSIQYNNAGAFDGFGTYTAATGLVTIDGLMQWDTGRAITASAYQVGRDNSATNQLVFQSPVGSTMSWLVGGSEYLALSTLGSFYIGNVRTGLGGEQFGVQSQSAANLTFQVVGASGQTAPLFRARTIAGTVQFTIEKQGALTVSPTAESSGVPYTASFTQVAHTGGTAGTEWVGVRFNLSATKTSAGGDKTNQREFLINAPTYASSGAVDITNSSTFVVDGSPISGSGVIQQITSAFWLQSHNTYGLTGSLNLRVDSIGIADGIANTQVLAAIGIVPATTISLGNTTGTTGVVAAGYFPAITYTATTNTRTVTDLNTIYVGGAPDSASSLVAVTNGVWGALISGRCDNFYNNASRLTRAIHVPDYEVFLKNTTQITASGMAALGIGQATISQAGGAVTLDKFATIYAKGAGIAGGSVTITDNYVAWFDAGTSRFDSWTITQQNSIAAANDFTPTSNQIYITGATQINRLVAPPTSSSHSALLTLIFASNPVVKHSQAAGGGFFPILLNGSVDFSTAANSTLTLAWDSVNSVWQELGRKVA